MYENALVYLVGYAGTGKYTIARALVDAYPQFRLVDNHLINNPLFSLIEQDGKTPLPARVWDNQSKIWEAVFDTMIHVAAPQTSFVLTNALYKSLPGDVQQFADVENVAAQRSALFVPARLTLGVEEHVRRITAQGRAERFKMTDAEAPAKFAESDELLPIDHPNALHLDVTDISPEQSVAAICAHIENIRQNKPAREPKI